MIHKLKSVALFFFSFLLLTVSCPVVSGASTDSRTVRVAFPIQNGLTYMDDNGNYSGYTYDYLQEIAQYTGWNYEFVQVSGNENDQLVTLMEMLKNGQVDLMGGMLYSQELAASYKVCSYNYGTMETVLQALNGSDLNLLEGDGELRQVRVAVNSTAGRLARDLASFCEANLLEPVYVECANDEEMVSALRENRADVLLNTSMNPIPGVHIVVSFAPRQFYFITGKDNAAISDELDQAISTLNQIDPFFKDKLEEKYFSSLDYSLNLTAAEKEYIAQAEPLKVGVLSDSPPYQYTDLTGELHGINLDVLKAISQSTGLEFSPFFSENADELFSMMESGEIQLLAGVPYNYDYAKEHQILLSRPFLTAPYATLSRHISEGETLTDKKLALPKSNLYHMYFQGEVTYYETTRDCVFAVRSGKADYTYVDVYTAQYYMNFPDFQNLTMTPQTYSGKAVAFGICRPARKELISIINKAVLALPVTTLQDILFQNTASQSKGWQHLITNHPLLCLAVVGAVFFLILLLMILLLWHRSKAEKKLSLELEKHLQLYSVSNELLFEYNYSTGELLFNMTDESGEGRRILRYNSRTIPENEGSRQSLHSLMEVISDVNETTFEKALSMTGAADSWHWFRIIVQRVRDKSGTPIYCIGRMNIIDDQKKEREELLEKAQRDSLTHLYNIETSQQLIEEALSSMKPQQNGGLLILDVDLFKKVNDTYGHMRGDEALVEIASTLQSVCGLESVIGRQGGDEFIVYLPEIQGMDELNRYCKRILEKIREVSVESDYFLGSSIGAVLSHAGDTYPSLYPIADQALYFVKNSGRNSYRAVDSQAELEK